MKQSITLVMDTRERTLMKRLGLPIAIMDELAAEFDDVRLWDHEWEFILERLYGKLASKRVFDKEELSALKDKLEKVIK